MAISKPILRLLIRILLIIILQICAIYQIRTYFFVDEFDHMQWRAHGFWLLLLLGSIMYMYWYISDFIKIIKSNRDNGESSHFVSHTKRRG